MRKPSSEYARVFTSIAVGAFLLVTGMIGWNVSYLRGLFEGGRWDTAPILWQVGMGAALILLGTFWARRVNAADPRVCSSPSETFSRR